MGRPPKPVLERIEALTITDSRGCWVYAPGRASSSGYRQVLVGPRMLRYAHRVTYEALVGPIPDGMQLDHLCRNRACVNPAHLEPVSPRENTMRSPMSMAAVNSRKTHCPQGHPLTPENVYGAPKRRQCKTCTNTRASERWRRKRAALLTETKEAV